MEVDEDAKRLKFLRKWTENMKRSLAPVSMGCDGLLELIEIGERSLARVRVLEALPDELREDIYDLAVERDALKAALEAYGYDPDLIIAQAKELSAPAGAVKASIKSHGGGVEPEPHGLRNSTAAEQPDREPCSNCANGCHHDQAEPGCRCMFSGCSYLPEPAPAGPGKPYGRCRDCGKTVFDDGYGHELGCQNPACPSRRRE